MYSVNDIISLSGLKGIHTVDEYVSATGCIGELRYILGASYKISELSDKQVAYLYFSLNDIIVVRRKDTYYLATMNRDILLSMKKEGWLIPTDSDPDLKKAQLIYDNLVLSEINKYLELGKFKLVKLCSKGTGSAFLARLSSMNPYPSLKDASVYCMSGLQSFYVDVVQMINSGGALVNGTRYVKCLNIPPMFCRLDMEGEEGVVTSMCLLSVESVEPASSNELEQQLRSGVIKIGSDCYTLNLEILEKFYGAETLWGKLESIGVRYSACLNELMRFGESKEVGYYISRYNLDINVSNLNDLDKELHNRLVKRKKSNGVVSARLLSNSVFSGKKSYYRTINLNNDIDWKSVDLEDVLPKDFYYSAICNDSGMWTVHIKATSRKSALSQGKKEFERAYGKQVKFLQLSDKDDYYRISYILQKRLCEQLMWGYSTNYKGYSSVIKEICTDNRVSVGDDEIKFIFINDLAGKIRNSSELSFAECMINFISFLDILKDTGRRTKALQEAYKKVALMQAKKAYTKMNNEVLEPNKVISTEYAKFFVDKDGKIGNEVELMFHGRSLGRCQIF